MGTGTIVHHKKPPPLGGGLAVYNQYADMAGGLIVPVPIFPKREINVWRY
jgi:hypothetical protein